ncbi:nascent polypeptide-associated complex protein [Candidatus Woesearchaeota archaeon]|nr:nascent polypeptide-associated complex protein [Candidatus Woesearchaeota archaeon]
MFPGVNPKQLQQAMKRMGINQQEIHATEVIIKTKDSEIYIQNPEVLKVSMGGQDSLQITGKMEHRLLKNYTGEDVKTVMSQAKCSEEKAIGALEKSNGDLAEAILSLEI